MKQKLIEYLQRIASSFGIDPVLVAVEYPESLEHGDYSTNIAMRGKRSIVGLYGARTDKSTVVTSKGRKFSSPRDLAEKIVAEFRKDIPEFIESISIAGPGFINFKIKDQAFASAAARIAQEKEYGWGGADKGKKIMVEYTDPNPFKEFHIGHLMSNAIGESISRLIESQGAKVVRANWQGDVGPHVAKAVWGAMQGETAWGKAYVRGAQAYDEDPTAKKEIDEINKKIYARSDPAVNALYDRGRAESLAAFEAIYQRLGTKFDNYFFEGTEGRNGEAIVEKHLAQGVFERSEGAVVFKGEEHGLHTRVFITSQGLPTYETKELGLNAEKFKLYPDLSESVIITANEQSDYFRVLLKVLSLIAPHIADRTKHMSHGLMRFASGKMSSRKGNVITGEGLLAEIKAMVMEKMIERELSPEEKEAIADVVAVGAVKYTVLRSSVGSDIIFDSAASISFEGDSGPYLQYSAVRAAAVLGKEKEARSKKQGESAIVFPEKTGLLERLISRFPDIVSRARAEYAPQLVATYLIELAGAFNSFYAAQVIIDDKDPLSPYRLALTQAFLTTMTNGLWILGIKVPKKM